MEEDIYIEEWKDIIDLGFDVEPDKYYISNTGRIYSRYYNRLLNPNISRYGYKYCHLSQVNNPKVKFALIHRLVALAFVPNPYNKDTVNHINGDKLNNNFDNLEWVTSAENTRHAINTGLRDLNGENSPRAKLDNNTVRKICDLMSKGYKNRDILEIINNAINDKGISISRKYLERIRRRETWKSVSKDYSW